MTLPNESEIITQLSEMIVKAGANLFKSTKYIYAFTAENYFKGSIRDLFVVILNDIFNADKLSAFQLSLEDERCSAVNTRAYFDIYRLIIYSLAVRLPDLCNVGNNSRLLDAKQIKAVYDKVIERGVKTHGEVIEENYQDIFTAVRKGKSIPVYNAEWFKGYIYTAIPELSEINNRNLFFMGAVDVLFPLYYICLGEAFDKYIQTHL